jgi:hypothetical protein
MATWTFDVTPGRYRVSATWVPHANRAIDAPYTIFDGTTALSTVRVSQEQPPNDFEDPQDTWWEDLDEPDGGPDTVPTYEITGDTLVVKLTNDANEYVIADAVRIERVQPGLSIDDVELQEGNNGTTEFVFTVTLSEALDELVTVDWGTADGTATAGEDYVAGNGTVPFAPEETEKIVIVQVNGDTTVEMDEVFYVNLSNAIGAPIIDDQGMGTIRNDEVIPIQICDDGDSCFDSVGFQRYFAAGYEGYEEDVHFAPAGNGSAMATWTFDVTPGRYRVSATWVPHANRAIDAPYTINNGSPIRINQELAPNDASYTHVLDPESGTYFADLDTGFSLLSGGTITVKLTNAANEFVIADAVRIERVGDA